MIFVVRVKASHNIVLDHSPNPGVVEEASFFGGSNPYNFFVGVAGYRDGEASGEFSLEVEITEPAPPHCPESLPGATYPTWPSSVELIELDAEGSGSGSGDLSTRSCVNWAWFQTFPALLGSPAPCGHRRSNPSLKLAACPFFAERHGESGKLCPAMQPRAPAANSCIRFARKR